MGRCHRHAVAHYRARHRPATPNRGAWSQNEVLRLSEILDRATDGLGHARHGEVLALARLWVRSQQGVTQRLVRLRAERRGVRP